MGEFDTTFGALCIGYVIAWGCAAFQFIKPGLILIPRTIFLRLFGVMSMQTFIYFQKFEKDKLWLKLLVIGLWYLSTQSIRSLSAWY